MSWEKERRMHQEERTALMHEEKCNCVTNENAKETERAQELEMWAESKNAGLISHVRVLVLIQLSAKPWEGFQQEDDMYR
jgi:hypothetical protein